GEALAMGDLRLKFQRAKHFIQAYAMRLECGGSSLTYSADTAPCDEMVEFARASSLFLCEATLGSGEEAGERGHSSAIEAGRMAARAGAKRLVLTHYRFADSVDKIIREAQGEYNGPVDAAASGLKLSI
ncbi:MAG TPA: MBL fold metallo-hydrolase, partial [Candidatus Nitrosotalea sp.]|nr:MBL fold metallo-hydrolase [Candidatus Nitrosotalea sp.]